VSPGRGSTPRLFPVVTHCKDDTSKDVMHDEG
jgi:hypothetical protein